MVPAHDNSWDALLEPGRATDYFTWDAAPPFDPSRSDWSTANAWWLAELSRTIYRRDDRSQFLARAGLVEREFIELGSTQCAVVGPASGTAFSILVFRGTSELRDWLTNVDAVPMDWPAAGRVHRGFGRACTRIWDRVAVHLDTTDTPTFYTGHSLGGALATLAASMRPATACYTFGAPRVGDAAFCTTVDTPLYRVVNHRDLVTTVPPRGPAGFAHCGILAYISAERHLLFDPPPERIAAKRDAQSRLVDELADRRRWFDPHESLADHAPINYVAHLSRLI